MEITYVIAKWVEDLAWAEGLKTEVILKGTHMPNVGREPASYFHFIISRYHELEGEYVFTQGNPFDHVPGFLESQDNYFGDWLECDLDGNPHHGGLPIRGVLDALNMPHPARLRFKPGCLFRVSAETIRSYPIDFYLKCYALCCMNKEYPYVFERIFPLIFSLDNV